MTVLLEYFELLLLIMEIEKGVHLLLGHPSESAPDICVGFLKGGSGFTKSSVAQE